MSSTRPSNVLPLLTLPLLRRFEIALCADAGVNDVEFNAPPVIMLVGEAESKLFLLDTSGFGKQMRWLDGKYEGGVS